MPRAVISWCTSAWYSQVPSARVIGCCLCVKGLQGWRCVGVAMTSAIGCCLCLALSVITDLGMLGNYAALQEHAREDCCGAHLTDPR